MTYLFLPYTSCPSSTDKNFINVSYGGYAHCIKRNSKGYTLPNCVAFCHGMWLRTLTEALGLEKAKAIESEMCRNNAEVYWGYNDGFERGQTPKLGAIMVWEGKGSLAGHVMTVTTIKDNGDVVATGSDYGGSKFYTKTYYAGKGYNFNSNYTFLGFIYPPVEFAYTVGTPKAKNAKKDQLLVSIGNLRARSSASTSGTVMGYVNPGYYNINYKIVEADGYKWYQIEKGMWCAGVSGTEFIPKVKDPHYDILVHDVNGTQADAIIAAANDAGAHDITKTQILTIETF